MEMQGNQPSCVFCCVCNAVAAEHIFVVQVGLYGNLIYFLVVALTGRHVAHAAPHSENVIWYADAAAGAVGGAAGSGAICAAAAGKEAGRR